MFVEVTAATDLGEGLETRISLFPVCTVSLKRNLQQHLMKACPTCGEEVPWIDIWKGGLELLWRSHAPSNQIGGFRLATDVIGDPEITLDTNLWGTALTAAEIQEKNAFFDFVKGAPISAEDAQALARLATRGRTVKTTRPLTEHERDDLLGRQLVRHDRTQTNGRRVKLPETGAKAK